MARPKRSSEVLQKAEVRKGALQSISPTLDLGNQLTLEAYSASIQFLRSQIDTYNSALSELDDLARQIKDSERQLRDLSEQMLLGVAVKYGKDSREYGKAGGVPKSERRRSARKKTLESAQDSSQPVAIAEPVAEPTNGNGKVAV
ncbi:hypothetical protein H6G89_22195 [Oscillatoria sp. FACHB-1407]|uniref:hypothetical protein n=1 Tax=Oscillatoria sp. FACHB-1407 TaxID=2692847 RepID=UPI0016858B77|nr:hypothetical protein [Oscillatoria sp. FACHB-1407]MBD2463716.1 hypothetical protein [Oscillatoria sp. FACHB-1407]